MKKKKKKEKKGGEREEVGERIQRQLIFKLEFFFFFSSFLDNEPC